MSIKFEKDILIQRRDGTVYDLGAEGILVVSFDPPTPNYQHTYSQIGDFGADLVATQVQQTSIPLVFDVFARDNYDYELQRLKVLKIFSSVEPFYVINSRAPFMRWKVVADGFSYPRLGNYWKAKSVSVNLVCYEGYAESTATTLNPFTFNDGSYGIGMTIPFETPFYKFINKNKFKFYNASVIPLLANERPVTINFKGNSLNGMTIINHTTEQSFTYKKALTTNDDFKLIGLVPVVNGIQRLGNDYSSRSFLDFAQGYNDIEIVGASNFTISFETRFYY